MAPAEILPSLDEHKEDRLTFGAGPARLSAITDIMLLYDGRSDGTIRTVDIAHDPQSRSQEVLP
jgi:hypothetical protein